MNGDLDPLGRTLASGTDEEKLAALKQMRSRVCDGEPRRFFDLARREVVSSNNDIRWQSLIVIGEYIVSGKLNEEIWSVIVEHCGADDDMRAALATILLEHLLEHDFGHTVERIRDAMTEGSPQLLDTVRRCWRFGQPPGKWRDFQEMIRHGDSDWDSGDSGGDSG